MFFVKSFLVMLIVWALKPKHFKYIAIFVTILTIAYGVTIVLEKG